MSGPSATEIVRFAWPDESAPLARVLPVILAGDGVEYVVAPGQAVRLPYSRITAIALVPGSRPLVATLDLQAHGRLVLPFSTEAVAFGANPKRNARRLTVAFDVGAWSASPLAPTQSPELALSLHGETLRVSSRKGEDRTTASARLLVAARATPGRVVAVPLLGPGETADVDMATERPLGERPALVPSDARSRLLLAYLGAGQHEVAHAMAVQFARVLGEERPIAWSQPSLAQLLVGYSLAVADDEPRLAAWCRRTRSDRLLGVDGLVLAATAAWQQERPKQAAHFLLAAARAGAPSLSLGLVLAVRLAYELLAEGVEREPLNRLVTTYSVTTTRSDPLADTITTPTSSHQPLSLEGRGWIPRLRWALRYLAVRAQLPYVIRSTTNAVHVILDQPAAGELRASPWHFGGSMDSRLLRSLALVLFAAWIMVLVAVVAMVALGDENWNGLVAPLGVLQAAVFTLLGVAISNAHRENDVEREFQQSRRLRESELRVREVEEEAMKGRALAAALQADAGPSASSDLLRHARLSRGLFGDLLAEEATDSGATESTEM